MMDELGPDEQRWLDVLRGADEPKAADHARNRAAVLAIVTGVGAGSAVGGATGLASAAVRGTGLFAAPWKIGVLAISLALAGGGGFWALRGAGNVTDNPAPTVAMSENAMVTSAQNGIGAPTEPSKPGESEPIAVASADPPRTEVAPVPTLAPPPRARSSPSAQPDTDDVEAEMRLLTQAQRALEHGSPGGALQALARHRREFPHASLAVEREGLRAVASCSAKLADGRALAERFVAQYPSSPLVARVRTACFSP
jgi:hypothetical protein